MKTTILGLALSVALSGAVLADSAMRPDVTGVIQGQISALQADDFAQAFTFASPMIKRMFGNPDRFGQMVRQGYPMVWRPDAVTYAETREEGALVYQKVIIRDGSGTLHFLEYEMIPTDSGWQINGVQMLKAPEVGA